MGLFSKKSSRDNEPADPNERSPQLGLRFKDLAVMGSLIDAGADLTQPRHVMYFLYFANRGVATRAGAAATRQGYTAEVREPLGQYPGRWALVCERHDAVTSPAFVRSADDFFQSLADSHAGDYDGWEASV